MLFFDPVFYLATRAVVVFVEGAGVGVAVGQVGEDEAWVGAFAQVFGFGDDVARAAPGLLGAVAEGGEHACGHTGYQVTQMGVAQFLADSLEKALVLGEAQ